jgi:hypothetical protein
VRSRASEDRVEVGPAGSTLGMSARESIEHPTRAELFGIERGQDSGRVLTVFAVELVQRRRELEASAT